MRINNENDLEIIIPKEDPENIGFFIIPSFELFSISRQGVVLNRIKKKILKTHISKTKYQTVNIFNGTIRAPKKLHRLLAITFIGRPSRHLDKEHKHLEVNHISGIRLDNDLNNLEWCTGVENVQHFRYIKNHTLDKPVLAKNILTGAIIEFSSSKKCAEFFNIPRATFHKTLQSPYCNKFYKNNHIFKFKNENIWISYCQEDMKEIGSSKKFFIIPKITHEQIKELVLLKRQYKYSCRKLGSLFNLDHSTVKTYLNKYKDIIS